MLRVLPLAPLAPLALLALLALLAAAVVAAVAAIVAAAAAAAAAAVRIGAVALAVAMLPLRILVALGVLIYICLFPLSSVGESHVVGLPGDKGVMRLKGGDLERIA